jgi:hypothetical protein
LPDHPPGRKNALRFSRRQESAENSYEENPSKAAGPTNSLLIGKNKIAMNHTTGLAAGKLP